MVIYYGCDIPEDLYYHPKHDCWLRFDSDGTVIMGMTDIAQTMAGKLIHLRFKRVGKTLKAGKNAVTIESGKWVGGFVVPFDAEILATNAEAFEKDILVANKDPYGEGWLIKVRALQPDRGREAFLTGEEAVEHFKKRITEDDIRCFRCVD